MKEEENPCKKIRLEILLSYLRNGKHLDVTGCAFGCHWVYIWKNFEGNIEKFKMRLVVKDYAQKLSINFNKIFSLDIHFTTIKVMLATAIVMDLEFKQFDVKIIFLHSDLEEKIYIT